jgi:hypothetical protein
MKYVNPITKQVVEVVGVNTATKTYTIKEYADKFAEGVTITKTFSWASISAYHAQFFQDLQSTGEYASYVGEESYVDWPTDSEVPEYDAYYRVSLTNAQVVSITASEMFRGMITAIKQDHIKAHSKGVYVYLTQFEPGHPFLIRDVLQLTIEENPNKVVPEIDYTQPEWYVIPEPVVEEPVVEEPII